MPFRIRHRRPELPARRGVVVILIALLLPVFLLIVGFSVDLAHIQLSRTEMRLAVDAAARAGADELARSESLSKARERAKLVAEMNPVAGNLLSLESSDISFGRSTQNTSGAWNFTANNTPTNSIQIVGLRSRDSIDGQLNMLMGWYSNRSGMDLSVPAVAAFRTTDIGLVLDRSTSMKQSVTSNPGPSYDYRFCRAPLSDSGWMALDAAVAVFLNEVGATAADERVSIVTFGSNLSSHYCGALPASTLDQTLTSNMSTAKNAMATLASSVWNGNTNIAAGIDKSRQELMTGSQARSLADKFMLVLTDGHANEGNTISSASTAAAAGIKISTVTFGAAADQTSMRQVASIGGGIHYHAADAAQLADVFRKFAAQTALIIK